MLVASSGQTGASLDRMLEESPTTQFGVEDPELAEVDNREALGPMLAALPELERTIVVLRFFRSMSQAAIGERVGVSQMQVSRVLARTLRQLRGQLDQQGSDGERQTAGTGAGRSGHRWRAVLASALADRLAALAFAHGAPDAVRLLHGERVLAALLEHRAGAADGLGALFAGAPGRTAFGVRVEEEGAVYRHGTSHATASPTRRRPGSVGVSALP